ncbi:MAG: hypothetical protein ND866_06715 [Pyrinomonadaceae bacterium]|nr:hypothetical protein [Pyrinomonadaceae bacterium]
MRPRTCLLILSLLSIAMATTILTQRPSIAHSNSASTLLAAVKPTPTPDLPVTSTISDFADITDSNGDPQHVWMQIRSDGAPYTNGVNIQSIIPVFGNWILDSKNAITSTPRKIFFDFTKPVPNTGPNGGAPVAPFTSALVPARLTSQCHLYNNNMLTMTPGVTVNCPLAIFFADNGKEYFLHMNPVTGADVFPETDYVNVRCNGAANSQCNNWTMTADGTKGGCVTADCSVKQNIARLSLRVPVKGRSGAWTTVNQGDFYVAFSVGITNP